MAHAPADSGAGGGGGAGGGSGGGGGGGAVTAGPGMEFLDGSSGLGTPVIDANSDESGNLWAAAPDALYLRRPGAAAFRRYTNADGLHIYSTITAVAGGATDEVYVGLEGHDADNPSLDPLDLKEAGHAEHVHLQPDGTITSLHYADLHTDVSSNYWENPSARRLLYAHDGPARGHLFMGMNHGIDHVFNDTWGDHIHVEVYYPSGTGSYGEWYGLALEPGTGRLWTCGKMACGLENWNPDPRAWVGAGYEYAFTAFTGGHDLMVADGYREDFVGAAVGADGSAYMLSRPFGMASWLPVAGRFNYGDIRREIVPGMGTPVDVAADPDGTLWVADTTHVMRWDPASGAATPFAVPSSDIRRIELDAHASPRTLYIATGDGLLIYRGK
jgi:hypothetical protein